MKNLANLIEIVKQIARRAYSDGWTGASDYVLRPEDLSDLGISKQNRLGLDWPDRAEIQEAVRAELIDLTAKGKIASGEPEIVGQDELGLPIYRGLKL